MNGTVQKILAEVRLGLESLYGAHLCGVFLYGSYARDEEQWDSDIDVLIVLDRIDRYGAEIDRTSELISRVSLRCGISISRVFATQAAWREDQEGFLSQVRQEAVAA